MDSAVTSPAETALKGELARADRALNGVAPVLEHALASDGGGLVNDLLVARVRGMVNDLARQLEAWRSIESHDTSRLPDKTPDRLTHLLITDTPILRHLHASAIEGVLTEKLDRQSGLDPVLSSLWQELIASEDPVVSETAMQALAAQSRFMQAQRRMQQPILDLPPEVLERALRIWVRATNVDEEPSVTAAMRAIKSDYDEAQSRLGLITRLVSSMREGRIAALELDHAGLALFTSGIASLTGETRERAVLACHNQQVVRLAVCLIAAGLDRSAIEQQVVLLDPANTTPRGLSELSPDIARALLQKSATKGQW
ncbi:MAG: hypothetical protein AAF251_01005 [Pseudomonadota bacterium]